MDARAAILSHPGTRIILAVALLAAGCGSSGLPTSPSSGDTPRPAPQSPTEGAPGTARYRLTFDATWSAATHPQDFPASPHFSSLVGGTHTAAVRFWQEGQPASDGIRDMAERGRTSPLDQEIAAAVRSGTAGQVVVGGGIGSSPGSVSVEFDVGQDHPLVTFVSMIAPSPDWFVGVADLPLFENGRWVDERRVDLVPWDAGTDSGVTYTSPDRETRPRAPISRILTAPLAPAGNVGPLGRFTFLRLTN